jgi:hypothetical protein
MPLVGFNLYPIHWPSTKIHIIEKKRRWQASQTHLQLFSISIYESWKEPQLQLRSSSANCVVALYKMDQSPHLYLLQYTPTYKTVCVQYILYVYVLFQSLKFCLFFSGNFRLHFWESICSATFPVIPHQVGGWRVLTFDSLWRLV